MGRNFEEDLETMRREYPLEQTRGTSFEADLAAMRAAEGYQPVTPTQNSEGIKGLLRYLTDFAIGESSTLYTGLPDVVGEYVLAPMGKASEAIFDGESMFTRGAKNVFDWTNDKKKIFSDAYDTVTGGQANDWDERLHGAGTSAGYYLTGLATGGLAQTAWGLSPLVSAGLGYLTRNALEALTEGGNTASDLYAIDKSRYDDAVESGIYSLVPNLVFDTVQSGGEAILKGVLDKIVPGAGFLSDYIKGLTTEETNELLQEPRQQLVETAVKNTFKSGDMSWGNFYKNLNQELSKFDEYFKQVAPNTAWSTAITHTLLYPLGGGGNNNSTKSNQAEQQRYAKLNEIFSDLQTQRDELQTRINDISNFYTNDAEQDLRTATELDELHTQLQDLNDFIDNFWGGSAITDNPVQDDAGFDLFADIHNGNGNQHVATTNDDIANTRQNTPNNIQTGIPLGYQDNPNNQEQVSNIAQQSTTPETLIENTGDNYDDNEEEYSSKRRAQINTDDVQAVQGTQETQAAQPVTPLGQDAEQLSTSIPQQDSQQGNQQGNEETEDSKNIAEDWLRLANNTNYNQTTDNEVAQEADTEQSLYDKAANWVMGLLGNNNTGAKTGKTSTPVGNKNNVGTIRYKDSNKKGRTLTIKSGEFSDDYANEKQYFGRYLEATDEEGNVVARYSPYTRILQMADNVQDADIVRKAIINEAEQRGNKHLRNFGYFDNTGRLADDGNEDFRNKHRARLDTNLPGSSIHPNNLRQSAQQRIDTRAKAQQKVDAVKERRARKRVENDIVKKLEKAYDDIIAGKSIKENPIEGIAANAKQLYRKYLTRKHRNMRNSFRRTARATAIGYQALAHAYGMKVEEFVKSRPFDAISYLQAETDERINNPQNNIPKGTVQKAQIQVVPSYIDKEKKYHPEQLIMILGREADPSSALHEFGHGFLTELREVATTANDLPQDFRQDWLNLTKWLGVSDIDFTTPHSSWTDDQKERWQNAQEKWAVGLEKYFAEGKAPSTWLKGVFNKFKTWMAHIYGNAKNIRYMGEDKQFHSVEITPEVRKFYDNLFKDVPFVPNEEARQARLAKLKDVQQGAGNEVYYNQISPKNQGSSKFNLPFDPDELRTESGLPIDEKAKPSEMIVTPYGSLDLGYIPENVAEFPSGSIRANVGSVIHAEKEHGKQIRGMGYDNAKELLLDVLNNYSEIRRGTGKALLLSAQGDAKHSAMGVVELVDDNGIYRVKTLRVTRDRYLKNKQLLFTRSEPHATGPDSGLTFSSEHTQSQGKSELYARQSSNLNESLGFNGLNVNTPNAEKSRIKRSNNTFVTREDIERYDQLSIQGTPHIIIDNQFGLEYIGTGEGHQSYAWGLYFAQNPKVAETYRRLGKKNSGFNKVSLKLSNGKTFTFDDLFNQMEELRNTPASEASKLSLPEGVSPEGIFSAIKEFIYQYDDKYARNPDAWDFSRIKSEKLSELENLTKQPEYAFQSSSLEEAIRAINNITDFSVDSFSNGNMYFADIPENDVLLDWDTKKQPPKVKKAIKKVLAKLYDMGAYDDDVEKVAKSKTGEELYQNLRDALEPFVEDDSLPFQFKGKPIPRSDMAASLLLNQAGIPGLRYFDAGSRGDKQGTHNFVIWNTDMIKLLGLSKDSDEDAKQYFKEQQAKMQAKRKAKGKTQGSVEHYSQITNNQQNAEAQTSIAAKNLEKALEISRQQLNNVAQKYRGTEQWLKAPNGEKTNLSERQWLQVRTPNFKRWFGDWENDPKNASKVIDENGEPRVVYHGTPKGDFSVFRTEYGAYFTPDKGYAKTYAKYLESPTSKIYDVFLNIRKPFDTRNLTEQNIFKNEFFRKYGNGSPLSDRGLLDWTDADDMIDFLKEKEYDYDGLILDEGGIPDSSSETKFNWRGISYVPLNPTQIKSATNNNGNFDLRTDEIYNQIIGVKGAQEIDKRNGNTWLMDNLKIAKDMRKGKLSAKKIRMATGWELAPDRKWRYEIMDGKVNVEVLDDMLKTESSRRLKDLYDNNELYKAYPNLAEIKVLYFAGLPLGTIAAYGDDTIVLNPWHSPEVLASSFIHEIQHAVQDIEGFAAGGNPDIFKEAHAEEMDKIMNINNKRNDLIHKIEKDEPSIWQQINEVRENIQRKGLTLEEYQKALDKIYSRNIHYGKEYKELSKQSNKLYEKLVKKYGEYFNPFNLYKRLGGEIEARNTETRANFTEEQRRNTLLSDTEDATDWIIRDTDGTLHDWKADNMPLSESYAQIGKQHKADMGAALENALTRDTKLKQKYSRDGKEISTEQRAAIIKNAIDEIEKLGEEHKLPHKNGNPKLEKLAFHWFLNGNIILPEDGYKVVDAIKISERYHFDPMNYSDPNEILAEYNIQDIKNSERVDPDTVKEFSNKVDYGNGITVYKVANTKAGQLAVRRIIDTHWGKGANPWCLAARVDDDSEELETAWDYWNDYDSVTKRIAFQNGKLRAFCASDDGKNQWWNSKDKAAEDEIPYIRREDNKTIEYGYDEKTGESRKISEILPNGTELGYYPNGNVESKALPDKDKTTYHYYENGKESSITKNGYIVISWYRNGVKSCETLPDGTILEWYENRNRKRKDLPNGTRYHWYESGLLRVENIINNPGEETYHSYIDGIIEEGSDEFARLKKNKALHKDSEGNWRQLKRMSLPNMTSYGWYDNGNLESAKLPDGSERTWWENGNQKTEILPGNIRREWYENGNPKYERLSYRESRYWYENGNRQSETLPNGEERSWYENGQIKDFRYWDVHIHWYENGNLAGKMDREKFSKWRENGKREYDALARERINIQYDENEKVNSVFLLGEDKELTGKEAEDYFNDFKSEHPEYFVAEDTSAYSKDDEAEAHYPKGQTADEYLANSKDAEDASHDESKPNAESYNQFISIDAAERLAEAGLIAQSTGTTETLERAKELDAKHMPVSFIWRETGWIKGKDGHWRTEIPDGEIYDTFFQHPKSRTVKLKAFYKNPVLYAAYPELADMPLKIKKFDYNDNTAGYYDEIRKTIAVSQKYLESQNYDILHDVLIHEIQHAIQNSEGWEAGSELSREGRKIWGIINRLIHSMPHELQNKIVNAYNAMNAMKNGNTDEVDKIVATMNKAQKARWAKILDYREKFNVELKKYESVAGEVEARNTGIRRNFDMAKRRNTPPTLTEDTPRSKQILKHEVSRQASSNKNSFLTPEKYDQLMYHGTRHILYGNGFDLQHIGTGQGAQSYGYGAYLAQKKDVGQFYRQQGAPEETKSKIIFVDKNGKKFFEDDYISLIDKALRKIREEREYRGFRPEYITGIFLTNMRALVENDGTIKGTREYFKDLSIYTDTLGQRRAWEEILEHFMPAEVLENPEYREGNLYLFDGPEDDVLLNWDVSMREQPAEVLDKLKNSGFYLNDQETGEELYWRLTKDEGDAMRASMRLNELGIPGLRYFDNGSRDVQNGTHNFVIWNTDTLRLLGLTNNSDEDAQEYFHTIDYNNARIDSLDNDSDVQDYSKGDYMAYMSHIDDIANAHTDALDNRPDIEKYNQVIGEKGAKSIDSINGNNKMLNALQMAKKMNSKGVKPRTIKRATGWELGTEGKWKYEIQDGKLHNPEGKQYLSLRDFYENQQLFTAYPSFNDINVAFDIEDDMHESPVFNETPIGYFDKETLTFHLQRNFKNHWKFIDKLPETDYRHDEVQAIKSWLVGQLQELIQSRENFAMARSLDWFSDRSKPVQRVDDNGKLYWTAVNERPERAMKHSAGNIEVQNVQARTDVSPELRREILLSDTEPVAKNEQIVTNWKTKSENYMADEYGNALFDAMDNVPHSELYSNHGERYDQIGKDRKATSNAEIYHQTAQTKNNDVTRSTDDFLTPEAKAQMKAVRKQYEGTDMWLKAPNGEKSNLNEHQWLTVRTPAFKEWFGDWENDPENASKILDENGEPKVVYHGTGRADRIGGVFRSDRATSGPMAFFTDNKEIAENYSKNKADTSLSREGAGDYHKMFFVEEKVEGRRKPQKIFLEDYWYYLPYETKRKIAQIAPTITYDYDNDYEIISKPNNKMGTGGYELHIREAKGNHLKALIAEWLDSANLFNEEEKFLDVLKLVGLDNVKYLDPYYREEAVYPVFMNMRNPFNTANISESDLKSIRRSAVAAERFFDPNKAYDSDAWDKTTISPMDWLERLEDDIKENTTHAWTSIPDFVTNRLKKLGYDGIQDTGGKYHTEKHNVYIPFKSTQIKSSTKNNGNYKGNNPEIYHQTANGNSDTDNLTTDSTTSLTTSLHTNNLHTKRASSLQTNSDIRNYVKTLHDNPFVESYSQIRFNDKSETLYRNSYGREDPKQAAGNVKRTFNDFLKGFKGDFPLLAGKEAKDKDFTAAREILRIMNRNTKAKAHMTMLSLYDSLRKLSPEQFDIFSRMMMLNDIHTFVKNNPDVNELPLGYDREGLLKDWRKYKTLAEKDKDVIKAIKTEYDNNNKARNDLINVAKELGLVDLAKKIKSADLFLVQYANILDKDSGFNTNYVEATAMMRNAMLQDFEKLLALKKLEQKGYDIRTALEDEYGKNWDRHIPKGYRVFNPLEGNFITSAASLQDEVLKRAFFSAMELLGMSREAMNKLYRKVAGVVKTRSMVMPTEIVKTLESIINPIPDSALTKFAQAITSPWKKHVLYFPTRAFKYNLRNLTGDLDAVLAGDPTAVRYVPQALKELYTAYYGDGADISQELKEFQARGGALTVQSVQELGDYREMKKFNALINELSGKEQSTWKNLPRQSLDLLDKVFNSGIQNFSDFREQWLRYAAYLDYLQQMRNNHGVPRNFGASVREEVMAIDDIRDRAFKLANELLGAYDQVSESGKQLRKALIPFYSWIEVNAKRYVQLMKNGLTEDDFLTAKLPQIAAAQIPGLTYKLAKTWFLLNFFSLLVSAFNHLFFPEDEEELPPEIQAKPHITLGHDDKGNIRYFSQVGAYADALEWFALDTFRYDVKRILNGQETITNWLGRFMTAPLNKVFGGLSPFIKTPIEVGAKVSFYPDMFNPRPMRDRLRGIAQSFGLSWPYKAAAYKMGTGETYSNWDEFRKLFIYLEDAEYGAYNYARSLVRQYKEIKLGEKTSFSASETGRSNAMRKFRAALRLNDKAEADNAIEEYIDMAGTRKSAEQSINNMNPLHGLKKEYHEDFNRWMSKEDRVFFDRAMGYYDKFATKALKIINNHDFKRRRKPR